MELDASVVTVIAGKTTVKFVHVSITLDASILQFEF